MIIRASILVAVALLIAGGSLIGRSTTSETAKGLSRVGYILLAIALAIMITLLIRLEKSQIARGDVIVSTTQYPAVRFEIRHAYKIAILVRSRCNFGHATARATNSRWSLV